jgi:ABC-type branched-subunit amino acid transport system substrate-binding protein
LVLGAGLVAGFTPGIVGASGETTVPGTEPAAAEPGGTEPEGTVGGGVVVRCGFAPSDTASGDIAGFAATQPAGELTPEFFERLCTVDPNLIDLNYAAEAYDAVTILALAAEVAGTDGIEMASEINGVTKEGTKCTSFAECRDLIAAGEDIDYDGASGPLEFDGNGEPTLASYGLFRMADNNRIDPTLTQYIQVQGQPRFTEDVPVVGTREGDGVLTIGQLLPQTGDLAYLGPPEIAGVNLAVEEINAAGGVLGADVVNIPGDSGDTNNPEVGVDTVERHLSEDVDAIIGAAASGVTRNVIDIVTGAGVVLFSPANTATDLSDWEDEGLYFRTAPPDIYQGDVLGQFIINEGNQSVAIIYRNDAYGVSLSEQVAMTIEEPGGEVVASIVYDPGADSFDSEVGQLVAADADAIVVIGFAESSRILRSMVEQGIGPRDVAVYGSDGNAGNALGVDFDAGN